MGEAAQTRTLETRLFRDVFNASPIGIAVENLEGQPLFVNPAFCSMLGFSEEELRNKHCVDFSPPEDAEKDWALFQQLKAGSIDHYQLEKRYFRKDGSLVWGRLSISLLNSHPSPLVVAMVEDITDKKRAEEARFRHAAIVESSDDAIISENLDGVIVSWNGSAQRIYGYTEGEAVGKPITILVPRELVDEEDKILERVRAGERIEHYETLRVTKEEKGINVSLSVSPIKDSSGRILGLCSISRDISDRKRGEEARRLAEQEFAKANERLQLAMEAGAAGGWDYDLKTGKDVWFGAAHAQLGMKRDETLGSRKEFWDRVHEDDRERVQHALQVAKEKREDFGEDIRVVWRDGTTHWLRSRGRFHYAANGEAERSVGISLDITERKRAEEALSRYAAIVESSEDAIASGTLDGIIVSWNTGAQHMYGYTEAEAIGKPITMILPPELRDEEKKILETVRAGGHISQFETVRVAKTGKRINVSLTISPIKDSSGRMVGVSGIARDITERKLAEEALRASEERLRLAQQVAHIGSFEWNIQTGVNTWTRELEAMYGLQPGTFTGTQTAFENLVHADDRAGVIKLVDHALKTGQPMEGEWRVVWADGSVHWITGRWQVFMDASGEPSKMMGVNIDVTERKRAEEALAEMNRTLVAQAASLQAREELLRVFVKNVPAAVAMLDRDMRYLQISDRWCSDNSVEASELLGRSRELSPEMPDRWKEVNRRALQGETLRAEEDRWESGGSTRWARWEVRPWRAADGTVGGILILTEDITHRKQMEEALSDMSRKLIESQEQERARIGRELHDDINQRLALLKVELEQLQEKPSEVGIRVQELRNQVTDISNDVQALSHDLHSSKLEYLGVVAGIKSWCKEFAERQRMEIDFKSDVPTAVPLEIGRSLFRVLQEALHNAVKHSGVKRVEVQLREESGEIHLITSDSGKGFDVEAALQGKGLGLTSMRERVRLVNGTISIESKPMGGTTIHVRVPFGSEQSFQRQAV
jgi:PAS domain S-box-containing protein